MWGCPLRARLLRGCWRPSGERSRDLPVCHGEGGGGWKSNASLNCSLSSLLKRFSLTGLVLCFCASPLSERPPPCLPPPPSMGRSEWRRRGWSRVDASSWGYKLRMCPSPVLSSHLSQPLPDMGLLPDLGPKMALVEADGSGGALTVWPAGLCTLHGPCGRTVPSWAGNPGEERGEVCSWAAAVISYGCVTSSGHISLMK